MYKEEKIINGILHYRTSPNAEFKPYTLENLTGIVGMLKEEMQKQEQGNIEGKDPITINFTNPKGGAIPKIGTKEFNDSLMEMFGGKSKQQTAVEWLEEQLNKNNEILFISDDLLEQAKEMEKQQQGYSEEEVIELLQKALTHKDDGEIGNLVTAQGQIRTANFFSWFNKFKKK
jgi:hypothetical protein